MACSDGSEPSAAQGSLIGDAGPDGNMPQDRSTDDSSTDASEPEPGEGLDSMLPLDDSTSMDEGNEDAGDTATGSSEPDTDDTDDMDPDAGATDEEPDDTSSDEPLEPAFAPCPSDGSTCRIMPLGDSITDGLGSSGGGYRVELFRQAVADGHGITFVGRQQNGPAMLDGQAFPRNHEGYSGATILHPNDSGYAAMADSWYAAIEAFLP